MKALRCHELGSPEVLRWEDVADPAPGASEVLIRVAAAGLNFADLNRRADRYPVTESLPLTLGLEAAGTIAGVAAGVRSFSAGDRVICRARGTHAELVVVPVDAVVRAPARCTIEEAAAIPIVFLTAYHMLRTLGPVAEGETVLIHAAASGVGCAAVQLAKLWGAHVFATASTDEKLALARGLGADELIDYTRHDFVAEVLARTANRGVDRVLECVGGDVLTRSLHAAAPGGLVVIYGRASGTLPPIASHEIFTKNLRIVGLHLSIPPWTPEQHRGAMGEVVALIERGKVHPVVDRVFPMAEAAAAHIYLAERRTRGKVVLVP